MNKPSKDLGHGDNVIDFTARKKSEAKKSPVFKAQAPGALVDMTERRNEMMTQERRTVRRTILSEFIGAFVIVPDKGLQRVALHDISDSGVSFDLSSEHGAFNAGEELAMRVYMNQHTYFPFIVKTHNVRRIFEEGVTRHGAGFVTGTINDVALHHFVRFIESVSASLETDHGDVLVTSLQR